MGKSIRLENLTKKYGDNTILSQINLSIQAGEKVVLLGPSGSGKSTLLRLIAGLETITDGKIYLDDKNANNIPCGERDMAMVFQNYALYPHMTVSDNITFGLKANKVPKLEIKQRLVDVLNMLQLEAYSKRLPKQLSGGQRQRVALARAVVKRSDYFLLDEPLSNLDVRLRLDARKELVNIHDTYKQTMVYVTHDQVEAMTIADKVVLLHKGIIQMVDTPKMVYEKPSNVFTASFIGAPPMNIIPIHYEVDVIKIGKQKIMLNDSWKDYLLKHTIGSTCYLGIRPEHLKISTQGGNLLGVVKYKELLGQHYAVVIDVEGNDIVVLSESDNWVITDKVYLEIPQKYMHFFSSETECNLGYPD